MPKEAKEIKIGLWGGVGSGKTTYLTMLLHYLRTREKSKWTVRIESSDYRRRLDAYINQIIDKRVFPFATDPADEAQLFHYILNPIKTQLWDMKAKNFQISLSFVDVAGIYYEKLLDADLPIIDSKTNEQKFSSIIDYLVQCDGVIILLDPDRERLDNGRSYREVLTELFEVCRDRWLEQKDEKDISNMLLEQHIAFCITKIDEHDPYWSAEEATSSAKKIMGNELYNSLSNYFYFDQDKINNPKRNRCKFYGISSIGRYFDPAENKYLSSVEYNSFKKETETETETEDANNESTPYLNLENKNLEGWATSSSTSDADSKYASGKPNKTIKTKILIEPLGIYSPIEWLIQSIIKSR